MNMKKIIAVAICVGLSACNHNVSGTITVPTGQTLSLRDIKGNLVTVSSGNAVVSMQDKKLVLTGFNGKDKVELDANSLLPAYQQGGGQHNFPSSPTGQPVDIEEVTQNSDTAGAFHDGFESCSFSVQVPCPPPPPPPPPRGGNGGGNPPHNPPNDPPGNPPPGQGPGAGGPGGPGRGGHAAIVFQAANRKPAQFAGSGNACYVTRSGIQYVKYHFDGDAFELQLIMKQPGTDTQVGIFDGFTYENTKVYDVRGDCGPGRF